MLRSTFAALLAVFAVVWLPRDVFAGPPVYVGKKQAKRVPIFRIEHAGWDELLKKYVDENGLVQYQQWHSNPADRQKLDDYIDHLSTASRSSDALSTKDHRLAFWINAYNAVTVKGILREYPTTSIRNHTAKLWGYNIWKDLKLFVGGEPYSLEQIEHEILRKMSEPRIHFAIVCASKGCPRLLNEAYVAERLDAQLTTNSMDFFSRKQNFRYDESGQRFYLSSILSWFASDFGSSQAKRLSLIAKWIPESAKPSALANRVRVSYLDYDWSLNERR